MRYNHYNSIKLIKQIKIYQLVGSGKSIGKNSK